MAKELKTEVYEILDILNKSEKHRLATCIQENWQKTTLAYSKELNAYDPAVSIEKEMLLAFKQELERLDTKDTKISKILTSLEKRRILQTGPHVGATESPRMLTINWLGSLGVPKDEYYVVAMFSGIPFSNKSRPGRINRKTSSANLFPSNMQDGLVYKSIIPEKLMTEIAKMPEDFQKILPKAHTGHSYTKWALETCQNIESKILQKENLVYLDINEVVTNYLIQVLNNKDHIFYKIFFDPRIRKEFEKAFPREIMFYAPVLDGKYEVMDNFILNGNKLKNKQKEISLENPDDLIKELKNSRLCPALITGFLAIAFLNHFKCFGSFAQVEYLPVYQVKLSKLDFLKKYQIEKVPTANLTTGTFPKNSHYPVDIILGEEFGGDATMLLGDILLPMKNVLLESYFTGDARNNTKK